MKKSTILKLVSIVLVFAVTAACLPMMANAKTSSIRFGVISDIHYLAPSLKDTGGETWEEFVQNKHKEYNILDSLLDNALDGVVRNAAKNSETYVIIPGDLTKDGELESHKALAKKLEKFEKDSGISVFVVPGNHDINNSNAVTFENGEKEKAEITTPEQFREIYKNLGYDLADSFFVPEEGNKGGMLSYAVTLGSYRLIAVDSCIYSDDNGATDNEHETSGQLAEGVLEWVVAEAEKAEDNGLTVVGMQHHNLIPHNDIEEATFAPFVVNDWLKVADAYADAGMHFVFTGHLHSNDTNRHYSDNGEVIYDILSPTITGFPNYYKIIDFKTNGKKTDFGMQTLDIDKYQPVVADDGTVFEKPFAYTYSFERTFGEGSVNELIDGMINPAITDIFADISEAGGLGEYLKSKNLDLEKIIVDALGTNGLALGPVEILTVSGNVMSFINDLFAQIDNIYINNPEETLEKLGVIIDKILAFRLSDLPATLLTDKLGYEVNKDGCTVAEFATTVMLTYYAGDEDLSDYPYVADVLEGFDSGYLTQDLFNLLREVVVTDLVQNEILSNLDFNPGKLFPEWQMFYILGRVLQGTTELLLGGDNSFNNLINSALALPVVPEEYSSVDAIIDHLAGEYITFSQFESWGYTISWMLSSFLVDDNPEEGMDMNAEFTYSGPVEIKPSVEDYRLPSHVVMTLGENSSTEANITWLTKYSVTGTDIELVPYSENPKFTGNPTTGKKVNAEYELIGKTYPGADLGIFAFMPYTKDYAKHTIRLAGLEPGTKYSYRVGDAKRGWWSEAGVVETAGGKDDGFTFFYVTDPQAQRPEHYERFAEVIETASELYPDGRFIVSAGDQVDEGTNIKHWSRLFNSTDKLLELPFMPTTGNHEDEGAVITENFVIPNVPEQDLDSGVYYSYDYNGVHFTVLNTNDIVDDKLSDTQLEWLINDIKSSDAKWKIVILHKAPYSNGSHYDDGDVEGIRSQLGTLLPYLGVDLVLQGHDHVYLRTAPMAANAVIPCDESTATFNGLEYRMKYNPKGTIYSICGTSGVKVYKTKDVTATDESFPRAEALTTNSENSMFSAITVEGDCLYYNAYEVADGEAIRVDDFAITKTEDDAPVDKIENEEIQGIFESLISKLDVKNIWKFINFVFESYYRATSFFGKIF